MDQEIKSIQDIVSAQHHFLEFGWLVTWNITEGVLFIKHGNSDSHLKIDKSLRLTGIRCKERVFEIMPKKLTLTLIKSKLRLLRTAQLCTVKPRKSVFELLNQIKPAGSVKELYEAFEPNIKTENSDEEDQKKEITPFFCDICQKSFARQHYLTMHNNYKHYQENLKCQFCQYVCASEAGLERHVNSKHLKVPAVAKVPAKVKALSPPQESPRITRSSLKKGKRSGIFQSLPMQPEKHPKKEKPAYCEICHKNLSNFLNLLRHKETPTHKANARACKNLPPTQTNVSDDPEPEVVEVQTTEQDVNGNIDGDIPTYKILKPQNSGDDLKILLQKVDLSDLNLAGTDEEDKEAEENEKRSSRYTPAKKHASMTPLKSPVQAKKFNV